MGAYYNLISETSPNNKNLVLRVRVARIWCVPNMVAESVPYNMEIVLVDETGDRISATVPRYIIEKFQSMLKEGSAYFISNFHMIENVGSYRPTIFPYKIILTNNTAVSLDHAFIFPVNIFSFTPPPQLFSADYNTDHLTDVIGVLTGIGQTITNGKGGARSIKVIIELDSHGFRFRCMLFGHYVDQLHSFLSAGYGGVVVALMFAKVKQYGDIKVIQTTRESSKLIFNPNITEAIQLRDSFDREAYPLMVQSFHPSENDRWTVLYEDFLIYADRINIAELDFYKETKSIVILGTVDDIFGKDGWWYTSCSCGQTVSYKQGMFFCSFCNHHVVNIIPRYLLNVRVADDSGVSTFVLFDNVATSLLNITCAELVSQMTNENRPVHFVPPQIMDLVGQEYLFKVQVRRDNGVKCSSFGSNMMYRVISITKDEEIVDAFKGYKTYKEPDADDFEAYAHMDFESDYFTCNI